MIRSALAHAHCMGVGHERWIAPDGEWICMRCGHVERSDAPQFPAPPDRDWSALPKPGSWDDD